MTTDEVMAALERSAHGPTRNTYLRHGVPEPLLGVRYADMYALQKRIKRNHALAAELWSTGVHEARVVATLIADPASADAKLLGTWVKDLDCYPLADAFSKFAAGTAAVGPLIGPWTRSKSEWIGRSGWLVIAHLAQQADATPDVEYEAILETIESRIHTSKNRVKDAMNSALIAIGLRNRYLRARAIAAAQRIGPLDVDHGDTNCKTPDAVEYITKAEAHAAARRSKAAAKKRPR